MKFWAIESSHNGEWRPGLTFVRKSSARTVFARMKRQATKAGTWVEGQYRLAERDDGQKGGEK